MTAEVAPGELPAPAEIVANAAQIPTRLVEVCFTGLDVTMTVGPEDADLDNRWSTVHQPLLCEGESRIDSEELVIVLDAAGMLVAERDAHWAGPGTLVLTVGPGRPFIPSDWPDADERAEAFGILLADTRTDRRRRYALCWGCGQWVPPESRYDENLCHGCSSTVFDIVY